MARSSLHLLIEGVIMTTIVGGFMLTTAAIAVPAPATDKLAVPQNVSPPKFPLARICIGKHAELLCSQGGTAANLGPNVPVNPRQSFQSWIVPSGSQPGQLIIPGNITLFSGNSMDPHAIGGKINLVELP
jgi:hypothetical protein